MIISILYRISDVGIQSVDLEISSFSFEDLGLWCWCMVLVAALHRRRYIGRPTEYESVGRLFEIVQMRHIRPSEVTLFRLPFPKLRKSERMKFAASYVS